MTLEQWMWSARLARWIVKGSRQVKIQHKIAALVMAGALTLTGCSGGGDKDPATSTSPSSSAVPSELPTPDGPSTPPAPMTKLSNLDQISVSGEFGQVPEFNAPYPFQPEKTMTKVVIPGNGAKIADANSSVELHYVGVNARTGDVFDSSYVRGETAVFPLNQVIRGFANGLIDQHQGSRVVIAMTSGDGYDPNGQPAAGILPGDALMFIVDIVRVPLSGPSGEPVAAPADMPTVSESDGVPSITVPTGLPAPSEARAAALIQGHGPQLTATSQLSSHAKCVTWDGREIYNDYGQQPASDSANGRVMKSLWNALVGQNEGSRVLVQVPGAQAYPNGNGNPSIAPGTAIACVVDLLFVQQA